MLKQRVITALILLFVLLGTMLAPYQWPFEVFVLLLIAAAFWEWVRLSYPNIDGQGFSAIMASIAFAGAAWAIWQLCKNNVLFTAWLCAAALLAWCVLALPLMRYGLPGLNSTAHNLVLHAMGGLNLLACFVAIVFIHARWHPMVLLTLMAIVWAADIAGYFVGRAFGRRKLAPTISPNKTIEGAAGGFAFVALASIGFALFSPWPTYQSVVADSVGWLGMLAAVVVLTALSISGDLYESMLKRRAGVKDSSQLLPGHGGVLDRVDALVPVLPAGTLLLLILRGGFHF